MFSKKKKERTSERLHCWEQFQWIISSSLVHWLLMEIKAVYCWEHLFRICEKAFLILLKNCWSLFHLCSFGCSRWLKEEMHSSMQIITTCMNDISSSLLSMEDDKLTGIIIKSIYMSDSQCELLQEVSIWTINCGYCVGKVTAEMLQLSKTYFKEACYYAILSPKGNLGWSFQWI